MGIAAGDVLPLIAWVRARAHIEELKCTCELHRQRLQIQRPCIAIKLCNRCRRKGLALLQSSADCMQENGTGVGGDARLQGTYEQPSTGIAIRWHTNNVMPIARGAKTCNSIDTSIAIHCQAHDIVQTKCKL